MKLEDQVCSLELAKRLKELGCKQESVFYWKYDNGTLAKSGSSAKIETELLLGPQPHFKTLGTWFACSAFTVAELGEMLGEGFNSWKEETWRCYIWPPHYPCGPYTIEASTEADARAKMLIHLIEKGIVRP